MIVPNREVLLNWVAANVPEAVRPFASHCADQVIILMCSQASDLNHAKITAKLLEEVQRIASFLNVHYR